MLTRLCCMRLNTAGVVLGWLNIVGSLLGILMVSIIFGYADTLAQSIYENIKSDVTYEKIRMAIIIICSVSAAIILLNLLSSIMLVVGTMKESHLMLVPWLLNSAVGIVFGIIVHMSLLSMAIHYSAPFTDALGAVLPTALVLVLQIYIYLGIYSLFKQLQQNHEQQHPTTNSLE